MSDTERGQRQSDRDGRWNNVLSAIPGIVIRWSWPRRQSERAHTKQQHLPLAVCCCCWAGTGFTILRRCCKKFFIFIRYFDRCGLVFSGLTSHKSKIIIYQKLSSVHCQVYRAISQVREYTCSSSRCSDNCTTSEFIGGNQNKQDLKVPYQVWCNLVI